MKRIKNEFNEAIVNLLIKIKTDGVTSEFYEWIDRETFKQFYSKYAIK